MKQSDVTTPAEALLFMTECALATVIGMACKKNRCTSEYLRQIEIAQAGMVWINKYEIEPGEQHKWIRKVGKGSVSTWAERFEK